MIDILIAIGLIGFACISVVLLVYFANQPTKSKKEEPTLNQGNGTIYIPKIKDGSKLSIGKGHFITVIKVDQHFNWLQKKMWQFLLGIKVENYSEED